MRKLLITILTCLIGTGIAASQTTLSGKTATSSASPIFELVQSDSAGYTDPSTLSINPPTIGNLLVVFIAHRSNNSYTTHTITDSEGGWTQLEGLDVDLSDANARQSITAWAKVVTASTPTSITCDLSVASHSTFSVIREYSSSVPVDWLLEATTSGGMVDAAPAGPHSESIGTTASLPKISNLIIGAGFFRENGSSESPTSISVTGATIDNDATLYDGVSSNESNIWTAWEQENTGGTRSGTLNWSGSGIEGYGAIVAISGTVKSSAVSYVSSLSPIDGSLNDGSTTITVPSGCDYCVVAVSGYNGNANVFDGAGASITLDGSSMKLLRADDDVALSQLTGIFGLKNPSIGASKTLDWNWDGTANFSEGGTLIVSFYKNVADTSEIKSSGGDSVANESVSSLVTSTLTVSPDDMIVGVTGLFDSANTRTVTWTNLTDLQSEHRQQQDTHFGILASNNDITIQSNWTGGGFADAGVSAVVLKPKKTNFPSDSLISFWELDELNGNAIDVFSSNDLTDNNLVGSGATEGPTTNGFFRTFEASESQSFTRADDGTFDVGTGDFSWSAWVKLPSTVANNSNHPIIVKRANGNPANAGYELALIAKVTNNDYELDTTGSSISNGTTEVAFTTATIANTNMDQWVHLIFIVDRTANTMELYVDNVLHESVNISTVTGSLDNSDQFEIGERISTYSGAHISHVGFWKKALEETERKSLYNGGSPFSPSAPSYFPDDYIAFWKLEEGLGMRIDEGSNKLHLEDDNINTFYSGFTTGIVGNCADFTGGTEMYLTHPDDALLSFGDEDFTFSAWFNVDNYSDYGTYPIVSKQSGAAPNFEYELRMDSDNVLDWQVSDGSILELLSWDTTLSTGTWYHVVVWHDSVNNELGMVVNDGTPQTKAWSNGCNDGLNQFAVNYANGAKGDGWTDSLGVWNRVLTDAEITALYNYGNGAEPRGPQPTNPGKEHLLAWYAFDETGTPSSWADSSSNGFDLTNTGGDPTTTAKVGGQAAHFVSANSDYATNTSFPTTIFHQQDFSVAGWVRLESFPVDDAMRLFSVWGATTPDRHWFFRWEGWADYFEFSILNDGGTYAGQINSSVVTTTQWNHVAVVRGGGILSMYLDGVAQVNPVDISAQTLNSGQEDFEAGRDVNASSDYLDGQLDEWCFYNKALTESEIHWLYNNGIGRSYSELTDAVNDIPAGSLLKEDWEDTGLNGWTDIGTVDADYDLSTIPRLSGAGEAVEIDSTGGNASVGKNASSTSTSLSGFFDFEFDALPNLQKIVFLVRTQGLSDRGTLELNTTGRLVALASGGSADTGSVKLEPDTHYRIWWEYIAGNGTNGVFRVWVSENDFKPSQPECESTDGTGTDAVGRVVLYGETGLGRVYYDRIIVD